MGLGILYGADANRRVSAAPIAGVVVALAVLVAFACAGRAAMRLPLQDR